MPFGCATGTAVAAVDEAGRQVWLHSIGDRGIRMTLDSFAKATAQNGPRNRRVLRVIGPGEALAGSPRVYTRPLMAPPLPIPESYWVVPGLLLAGEYPFSFVEEEGRGRLRAFLDAGIRLFIDLTEARESGRTGPLDPYADALLEEAAARGLSVRTVRHPVRDMSVPAGDGLERIVAELEGAVERAEPAYVHCWGGIGRTGTAVASFLARHHGVTGDEALALLDVLWQDVPKSAIFPESPQTEEQRRAVRRFAGNGGGPR